MSVPGWYALVLLALASFRTWKLAAEDTILDRPRNAFIAWLDNGGNRSHRRAVYFETLLTCPWCAGFWISLAWWGAWQAWPHGSLVVSVPLAISAVVGVLAYFTPSDD